MQATALRSSVVPDVAVGESVGAIAVVVDAAVVEVAEQGAVVEVGAAAFDHGTPRWWASHQAAGTGAVLGAALRLADGGFALGRAEQP